MAKHKVTFTVNDATRSRKKHIKRCFLATMLLDTDNMPEKLIMLTVEYNVIYDGFIATSAERMIPAIISYQQHDDGCNYAVVRNLTKTIPPTKTESL